jgi:hypothetical protein
MDTVSKRKVPILWSCEIEACGGSRRPPVSDIRKRDSAPWFIIHPSLVGFRKPISARERGGARAMKTPLSRGRYRISV